VFVLALQRAVEYDNEHDYNQGAALSVALLFLVYAASSAGIVFLLTAFATGLMSRPWAQVVAGGILGFMLLVILAMWLLAVFIGLFDSSATARQFRTVMSRLALGSVIAVVLAMVSAMTVGLPFGLAWLTVMVWAPIALVKAARRTHGPGPFAPSSPVPA
jgi:hypothetical protein